MRDESKLTPVLRDGIHIIKMVLFKMLRSGLEERHPAWERADINRLAGAVINGLFGTPNREEPFLSFAKSNAALIDEETGRIAAEFPEMRIPITDALRVQFLCDSREGFDNERALLKARDLGILILEREIPLPDHFMTLARRLGEAHRVTRQVRIHPS
jgi:hypothetical protein